MGIHKNLRSLVNLIFNFLLVCFYENMDNEGLN